MIDYNKLTDININTTEGKLLMAAVAILTSLDHKHISSGKWGGMITPDTAVQQITELTNKIYYEEEYKQEQIIKQREETINKILRNNE